MGAFFADYAKVFLEQGKLVAAEYNYAKASELLNKAYGSEHLYTATVSADIARLYILQQRYAQAHTLIDQSLAVQEKIYGRVHQLLVPALLTKAEILFASRNSSKAEDLIDRALACAQRTSDVSMIARVKEQASQIRSSDGGYDIVAGNF